MASDHQFRYGEGIAGGYVGVQELGVVVVYVIDVHETFYPDHDNLEALSQFDVRFSTSSALLFTLFAVDNFLPNYYNEDFL